MFRRIISLIKDLVSWLALSQNRKLAFKYFRIGENIARKATKFTKTKKDDEGLNYIVKTFDTVSRDLSENQKVSFSKEIQQDDGSLKKLNLAYDVKEKKVFAGVGPANVEYDPANGKAKFSLGGLSFFL